jgi:hydrogenase assembly chaperone HypC/HupF
MCLGIPGRVVEMVPGFGDQLALVDVEGAGRRVNIGLLDEAPVPGQWVQIHMGSPSSSPIPRVPRRRWSGWS